MGVPLALALALLTDVIDHVLTQSASDASLQHHPYHMRGLSPYERDCVQPRMKYIWFEPHDIKGKNN